MKIRINQKISWLSLGVAILLAIFLMPNFSNAHPGRTAGDGCHYCRTNCDYWGVPWNQRHCHNGGEATIAKTSTPTPWKTIDWDVERKKYETSTPIPTLTPIKSPSISPTTIQLGNVAGMSNRNSNWDIPIALGIGAFIIVFAGFLVWVILQIIKIFRK